MKIHITMPLSSIVLLVAISAIFCLRAQAQEQSQSPPLVTLSVGWTYLYADQGSGQRSNLNGWYAKPSMPLGKGYAAFADFTNYYGANSKGSINSHGFTFGVSKDVFPRPKFRPAVFAEAGDVRTSNAGSIVNQFAFATGFNFAIPIQRWIAFSATPAEWVFLYPKGDPRNDFNSKIGLTFSVGRR